MMLSDANFFDLKEEQIKLFKQIYGQDQRPNSTILQQLVETTGLNIRIVRAWFKNERRKERKRLMEERRRQEKERKKQQKRLIKQNTEKHPPRENSDSSDLTESDSTITSGDCSSSSSNSSEDSSDADDNKNIKKSVLKTTEQINVTVKNVCSTSQQSKQQQQQIKQNTQKRNNFCINWLFVFLCFILFFSIIFIYLCKSETDVSDFIQKQHSTTICGPFNSSILLSVDLNDFLLAEKQIEEVIKTKSFIELFKADYENKEKINCTKMEGTKTFYCEMIKLRWF